MTYFLRFPDESTWIAAATDAGFYTKQIRACNKDGTYIADDPNTLIDEAWISILLAYTLNYAIDVIGIITRDGQYDLETGNVITPPTVLDGWHVNYIGELPAAWQQYIIKPVLPYRVFA